MYDTHLLVVKFCLDSYHSTGLSISTDTSPTAQPPCIVVLCVNRNDDCRVIMGEVLRDKLINNKLHKSLNINHKFFKNIHSLNKYILAFLK